MKDGLIEIGVQISEFYLICHIHALDYKQNFDWNLNTYYQNQRKIAKLWTQLMPIRVMKYEPANKNVYFPASNSRMLAECIGFRTFVMIPK